MAHMDEGVDDYPDDPDSVDFIHYDCNRLFVEGSDYPFFADRLFVNRLVSHVALLKRGAQQNKLFIFDGPPGCGKSTFLNNLLRKFEEYANTEEGLRYETVWRLERRNLFDMSDHQKSPFLSNVLQLLNHPDLKPGDLEPEKLADLKDGFLDVPCPSHDNPLLIIPKKFRRPFLDDLISNDEFKWHLFTDKEYDWVFRDMPCTICCSLYEAFLEKLKSPTEVFKLIYPRPYRFNRRIGTGISVFNPGDRPAKKLVLEYSDIEKQINSLIKESGSIRYIYSRYAKTNDGVYALMDIKSHNTERLIELHNIISEGVHKVEDIEENVSSLFIALMNPEDKKNIEDFQSFSDRIEYIRIPYVLDLKTEVEIYRNIFGKHIDEGFQPRVLHNFARVIIATRLSLKSEGLLEWIKEPGKYRLYCDENLQLLKMELYTGYIPRWLSEEDRREFNAKRRRKILAEAETEGDEGLSGRDAIKIFNEFYSTCFKEGCLIDMTALQKFFMKTREDLKELIPEGFMESLIRMYDYSTLQEVKESLYQYNEKRISKDVQNYIYAVNFEPGSSVTCQFTGDRLEISEDYLKSIENHLIDAGADHGKRIAFRKETQNEYTSRTLTQEIMLEEQPVTATGLYIDLYDRYVYKLKDQVLDPFLKNENFRQAIKDYGTEEFKTYDKKISSDVTSLMKNLWEKFHYTELGAKEICIYVIDKDLAKQFAVT